MGRKAIAAAVAVLAAGAAWAARDIPAGMGALPKGERAARVRRSPQFRDGQFRNAEQTRMMVRAGDDRHRVRELVRQGKQRKPAGPVPLAAPAAPTGPGPLRITWYGHASALVEIEGTRVLLDPVWSDRCSPSRLAGPHRLHPVPVPLSDVPPVDAIVISHDHYDHLDMATIVALTRDHAAPFLVPLGVGAHLERWGVPADRVIELDWDESARVGELTLTVTPAQHFSGRRIARRNYTLWGSWVIAGRQRRVFYSGDTGYFDGFARVGERHGPFDATLIQIGAYDTAWPDIHMTPEEGVAAHLEVRGGVMVPVHWATFVLAFHPWAEPADRVWKEAEARGVTLAVPRPGQTLDVDDPPAVDGWWQTLS